ncbi:RNA dependent RNA polymerase [Bacillus sp. UMB0728]|uniref:RNA dependent RNA polymerase n=1 Tax=Bacillus sp. UMB0728 TaxID=2066052 RepID=UPI000C76AF00|nr:hypothetical protein [Bacillus sp. UMB0728]PLR72299.1 hypothetical protein CYJ37_12135 [Bacillus sp. UMB0728]
MSEYNKQVYIMSLEASDLWSHMYRGTIIDHDYCGMIPYSLELIKLKKEGLRVRYISSRDKEISSDIINVKFKSKVKSGNELKKILTKKNKDNTNIDYASKLDEFIEIINKNESNFNWQEVSVDELRKQFYTEGFKVRNIVKSTGEIRETEYVVYKRSSSKSRTGQCLFIKKSLYNKMIKWSRMSLPLRKDMEIDLAGLLAYESLVGSSLEGTIKIDPNRILIVADVESKFKQVCNVVRKGEDKFLDSFKEETTVTNSLFDGESLLDSKYFDDGTSMKLLRNHMFKSAAFNCNVKQFLMDNCPVGIKYDEWQLTDMFGNNIFAKDIDFIITPNSLKALKFSKVIGSDKIMWEYWKQKVNEDGNIFGICKHEKPSKFGSDLSGNVLQQTSYQMINCLPLTKADVVELTKTEKDYIFRLKNDDDFFIEKIKEGANLINSNEMLLALYNINNKIINTNMFRKFRKDFIFGHMNHSKKGKIKLNGDYCVMLGNPMEYLKHAIGQFDIHSEPSLKDNEVHTGLFKFNKELVGFRNPNTSPSNVLIVKNIKNNDIDKYFNLTDNIVCVNAINFAIQDILSGADYDSDTVLLFDDPKLLQLGKKCYGNYLVCINNIEGQKKKYRLNKNDMYDIDCQLSTSQRNIGKVVNLGQFCMSVYWDLLNKDVRGEEVNELLKKVDVMTVLSGIAIDMAKKFYEINISAEIRNVEKNKFLKERKNKPNFWKYVSQSKTIKNRIEPYDCPMDYLINELDQLDYAAYRENVHLESFLIEKDISKANYRQFDKVINKITEMDDLIRSENAKFKDKDEKNTKIEDITLDLLNYLKKLKINEDTIYMIIRYISDTDNKLLLRVLNVLYQSQKEKFLKTFKNGDF